MRLRRLVLIALAVGALLAIAATSASAGRFLVSSGDFRIVWNPLRLYDSAFEVSINCNVTVEGTLHSRTIVKTRELLVGYITAAAVNEGTCTGGRFRLRLESLPWHVRYASFTGALPRIAEIDLHLIGVVVIATIPLFEGLICTYTTTAANPAIVTLKRTLETGVIFLVRVAGRIPPSPPICPEGNLENFGPLTRLGSTVSIEVRLI